MEGKKMEQTFEQKTLEKGVNTGTMGWNDRSPNAREHDPKQRRNRNRKRAKGDACA